MKTFVKYLVIIPLSIVLLYIYNEIVPKNLLTFILGLPIFIGIIVWIGSLFGKNKKEA